MRTSACYLAVLSFVCLGSNVSAQHQTELSAGYYVVVGAYASTRENVAQNYTEVLNRRGFNAAYGFNAARNFFFVYLKYFQNLKESLKDMQATRKQPEFAQAWVRVVPGDITAKVITPAPVKREVKFNTSPVIRQADTPIASSQPLEPVVVVVSAGETEVTDNEPIHQYDQITLGNTEVFLSLYNAKNTRIVEGVVKVLDADRVKLLKEVKGNEYLIMPDPKNKSGQLTMVCEAFGYRKVTQEINYPVPLADTAKNYIDLMGTTFVVNFDLVRYQKGDIGTLNNVSFYNDAAIMLPDSKNELNALLQMMRENSNYRIRLHGHTNGNYHGRIIMIGENKNFFSLDGSKSSMGSAKDLSYNRAEVIKEYLMANGIDPARIVVKGWGGRKALYDKHSVNAKKNVRVEVEILAE